ncbi:hypothetical protein ES703_91830 [subsurface metagenome]
MAGINHERVVATQDKGMAEDWNKDHKQTGNHDVEQHQFLNNVIENRTDFPAGPVAGQVIFRTDENRFYVWNGVKWDTFVSPATIVVAADGTGHTTNVQIGIDMLSVIGGVIYIKEGTYIGDVVINKNNVKLMGAGKSSHIKGALTATNISGVQVRDLQLETTTLTRNVIGGCDEFVISGCFIHGTALIGLSILVTERSMVLNNHVYGHAGAGAFGIYISANDAGEYVGPVKDCTVTGNICYNNQSVGISLFATPTNECDDNVITGNRVFGSGTGVFLNHANCNRNIIVSNTLNGTTTPIADDGTATEIAHNT